MNVKNNPRLINKDVYRFIASNSSLNQKQVEECFNVYKDMIYQLGTSQYIDEDITIPLPNIGYFYFTKRIGRKAGTTYKMPVRVKNEIRTVTLEEDEPTTHLLRFRVSVTLAKLIKEYFNKPR